MSYYQFGKNIIKPIDGALHRHLSPILMTAVGFVLIIRKSSSA